MPERSPVFWNYVRYSTPEQQWGDGDRRQVEKGRERATAIGLPFVDHHRDLGISAFKAKNRSAGALGRFLEDVRVGGASEPWPRAGDVLGVENFDRLSRAEPMEAFDLFRDIINSGIILQVRDQPIVYTYRFPAQDYKIRLGDRPILADTLASTGEVVRLDEDAFEISIKRAKNREPLPARFSLVPSGPIGDEVLRAAIARYVGAVLKGNENQYAALTGILRREFPRFIGFAGIGADPGEVARAVDAIGRLDESHLLVQGPPGAGKTYTASHAIVEMLSLGKRVGVASHSHKAINNLLFEVEKVAAARKLTFRGIKKSSYEEQFLNGSVIEDTIDNETATAGEHDLIAGTAWLFARDDLDQQLDYLFVDEAGQVSLANTIAMGVSARNVILIGDQMQLSQPLKGSHPGRSGWSALEHLLDGAATVPPERGIFLSASRRMHPDICQFVSDAFYDGRLMPEPGNERQCLVLDQSADPMLSPTGLRFVAVEHDGCSQRSEAEADRVREIYASLLGQRWTDRDGVIHPIGMADILVVSPYNMQVNLLRLCLPPGARVGTVDRFQGQQAAAVLISMTTSSGDDLPRQIEFLFSRNRLNVAVSRARHDACRLLAILIELSPMASYPQIIEYNEVIQHPATAFVDPELQQGRVKENALGLPVVLSGGFALTYTITTPQRQLAVRCFHRQIPAADQKYASISKQVESLNSKYFVGFNYLKQGIKVKQAVYPIVKMAWVQGDPLGIWLDKNSGNSVLVEKVRNEFVTLAGFLHQHGMAHGDIQNGNVMVSPSGITLIDYDGMYVPGMATGNGSETGHKHFQHPDREISHFGPLMDRFSFIALDLSLRTISDDTSLHKQFREGGETIIFRANDFVDPSNSEIFQILRQRPRLKVFADNFARICQSEIRAIPTLEDFLAGRNIPAGKPISSRPTANGDLPPSQPRAAKYIGAYPVLSTGDYGGVLRMVGQRIELVGCIQAVKHGTGRRGKGRGKPYIFVNFGHWRGNIVKLTIWSEGLAQLSDWPDDRWIGRWVSVVGLVDAPYSGKHYDFHYTHVGITIDNPQQINAITENEAKFRLGQMAPTFAWTAHGASKSDRRPSNGGFANRTIIGGIAGKTATNRPMAAPARQALPQGTTNQDILRSIRQGASAPPIQVPPRTGPAPRRSGVPTPSRAAASPNLLTRMLRLFGLSR